MTSTVALILAAGGSEQRAQRNLRPIGGRPLIYWTVQAALEGADSTAVSTDDAKVASVIHAMGVDVVLRPRPLTSSDPDPLAAHAAQTLADLGSSPDLFVIMEPDCPIRREGAVRRAVEQFERTGVDSLVGVVAATPRIWRRDLDLGVPLWDWQRRGLPQTLPGAHRYRETGSIAVSDARMLHRTRNRLGGRIGLFEMSPVEGLDADTLAGLADFEALLPRAGK